MLQLPHDLAVASCDSASNVDACSPVARASGVDFVSAWPQPRIVKGVPTSATKALRCNERMGGAAL